VVKELPTRGLTEAEVSPPRLSIRISQIAIPPPLTNPTAFPRNILMDRQLENLKYDANGLIPAIIQDHQTHEVLMMAWMNREAVAKTAETGLTHFFSRSRNQQWLKGESSGHVQHVKSIRTDCDQDVLLIDVEQVGAACHDGYYSCFYREHQKDGDWKIVGNKVFDPKTVYHK
jgi:phosphoribosyl-AMP cyclohydrolase